MLAHVAQEFEEAYVLEPVVIVDDLRGVRAFTEIKELRKLDFKSFEVVLYFVKGQQFALLRFSRRVSDHARGAADQGERLVAGELEMDEQHDRGEIADLERRRGRVEANVSNGRFLF